MISMNGLYLLGLLALVVVLPLAVMKMFLDYKQGGSARELRIDELEELVRDSVEEATRPLERRIEALEDEVEAIEGPSTRKASPDQGLIDDESVEGEELRRGRHRDRSDGSDAHPESPDSPDAGRA